MKQLIISLFLLSTSVFAQVAPIDVVNECIRQMSAGVCMATPDKSSIVPGQTMLISGVGRVSYSAYLDYMDLYNPSMPSDPAMCNLALTYMQNFPGSDHDLIARALWTPAPHENSYNVTELVINATIGAGIAAMAFIGFRSRKHVFKLIR